MAHVNLAELVSHLRTVHFFLVLTCVVAVVALQAGVPGVVKTAHDQMQKVQTMRDDWRRWVQDFGFKQMKWLQDHNLAWPDTMVSEVYIPPEELKQKTQKDLPQSAQGWSLEPLHSPMYLYLYVERPPERPTEKMLALRRARGRVSYPSREEILGHLFLGNPVSEIVPGGYWVDGRSPWGGNEGRVVGPPLLETLEDFRHFWNAAEQVRAVLVLEFSKAVYLVSNGLVTAELQWHTKPKDEHGYPHIPLDRGRIGQERKNCPEEIRKLWESQWRPQFEHFNEYFCGPTPKDHNHPESQTLVLLAHVRERQLPMNLRIWLAQHFGFSLAGKVFDEQFRELNEITQHYQTLDLDSANQILGDELARSGERVEFFELKFPENVIATWGTVIIVVIHLYFLLHLHALPSRLPPSQPELPVAWIGLYPDPWVRLFTLISISLLPFGVIVYLIYHTGWSLGMLVFIVPVIILEFVLCGLSLLELLTKRIE